MPDANPAGGASGSVEQLLILIMLAGAWVAGRYLSLVDSAAIATLLYIAIIATLALVD